MRFVFAWVCFAYGLPLILVAIVTLHVDGLTVLGAVLLGLWAWLLGVFSRAFWFSDDEEYGRVDVELDDEARR